jgi:SAM dependent carboxyl methyltransferase
MAPDAIATRTAMEGAGFYNKHSSVQAAGIARMLSLLEQAALEVPIGEETLVIADYGSSQGRNSMMPMRVAIEAVRSRPGPEKPVLVLHTDLPSNDFGSLFDALENDPNSYASNSSGIYSAAVGRSFFGAILPPEQVHLGWNSWAVHWLSQKTADAPDQLSPTLSTVPAVRAAAAQQSALDWECFLRSRSSELRVGGKLLCLVMIDTGETANTDPLWTYLWDSIVEVATEGKLTERDLLAITVPIWYRSLAELRAPFGTDGKFAALSLEHMETTSAPDPFWEAFERSGDAEQFGTSWANIMRAIASPSITAVIGADRSDVLDDICVRYAARIASEPRRYDWNLAAVVMSRDL